MAARYYRVLDWADPVGHGVSRSRFVHLNGIAKKALEEEPRIVANEYICAHLARAILLPVPPGFLIRDDGAEPWFVSLDFNISGERLPPVNPTALVEAHPQLVGGIVVFDMWVLNGDRHRGNVAFDTNSGGVGVFDHSRALLPETVDAEGHLTAARDQHGIPNHCLAGHVEVEAGIVEWTERAQAVPHFYLKEIVGEAKDLGLKAEECSLLLDFLLDRRERLLDLVEAHTERFPNLRPELPLGGPGEGELDEAPPLEQAESPGTPGAPGGTEEAIEEEVEK